MNPKMCYYCLCLYTIIRIYKCTVLQCIIRVDQGNGSAEIHLTAQFIARNILGVGCFVLFVAFNLFLSLFLSFFSLVVFCSTDHLHFLLVLLLLLYMCWAPVWLPIYWLAWSFLVFSGYTLLDCISNCGYIVKNILSFIIWAKHILKIP